jgi:glutathione S-transferase
MLSATTAHDAPTITTGYWNIRGLGAPIRMMCVYGGAERFGWEDRQYDLPQKTSDDATQSPQFDFAGCEWFKTDKPALKPQNALINLPYVVDTSEQPPLVVTQSTAVLQYLGRRLNLMGETERQRCRVEQTLAQAFDLRNDLMRLVYPFQGTTEENLGERAKEFFSKTAQGHLEKLEAFLVEGGGSYFAGESLTAGDFHVFEMVDQLELAAAQLVARGVVKIESPLASGAFPTLKAFRERVQREPKLESYFASGAAALPMNNKMAHIK